MQTIGTGLPFNSFENIEDDFTIHYTLQNARILYGRYSVLKYRATSFLKNDPNGYPSNTIITSLKQARHMQLRRVEETANAFSNILGFASLTPTIQLTTILKLFRKISRYLYECFLILSLLNSSTENLRLIPSKGDGGYL